MSIAASQIRAQCYHARALEAADLARSSSLAQVREKHELAADSWARLAELESRIAANGLARLSGASIVELAGPSTEARSRLPIF